MRKLAVTSLIMAIGLGLSVSAQAWTEYMRIINNTDQPISFQYAATKGSGAHPDNGTIAANTNGPSIGLTDGDWWQSNGTVTITQNKVQCVYRYKGVANKHSLTKLDYVSGPDQCKQANLLTQDATHDCDGPHNCIILSPDFGWVNKALTLQRTMSYAEPLSKHQIFGTHNSAVSKHYIDNFIDRKVALNHTLSITEQLNEGIRSIELDIVWSNDDLRICHFHTDSNPDILCYNNAHLSQLLNEINQWLNTHPDQFVFLYLDVNHPINDGKMIKVDELLQQTFGDRVYTEADANKVPLGPEGSQFSKPFPAARVSVQALLKQGKQVVVSAHKDFEDSPYVFMHLLNDHGVDNYVKLIDAGTPCEQASQQTFDDPSHDTLWRLNGDRAWASDVTNKDDYVTVHGITSTRACHLNMFSMDKLKNNDARVAAEIWSWQQGNPVDQGQANAHVYAVINPVTKRINNQTDLSNVTQTLCYRAKQAPHWLVTAFNHAVDPKSVVDIHNNAQKACHAQGGSFVSPVSSDEMMAILPLINQPVLINLFYSHRQQWLTNGGKPLSSLSR